MQKLSSEHATHSTPFVTDLGLYIHIPYCLQECHYCDFVKFEVRKLPPTKEYVKLLIKELKLNSFLRSKTVKTLYFGGGTPSLLTQKDFSILFENLHSSFDFSNLQEVTLEINPGTLTKPLLDFYKSIGINRYSLGVQSFHPDLLRACGRLHSPLDSLKDLELLAENQINFSADILFGLPHQSLSQLEFDLNTLLEFDPHHVSPYNLTLPENHFFNKHRPTDKNQIKMMDLISQTLLEKNIHRYEVSNFSKINYESKHNQIYWSDQEYLGLGIGAHSYLKQMPTYFKESITTPWGIRFWKGANYKKYASALDSQKNPVHAFEALKLHESLTDFCHTNLRRLRGLTKENLLQKYGRFLPNKLWQELNALVERNLLKHQDETWSLTSDGLKLPNEVFRNLCFLEEDMTNE